MNIPKVWEDFVFQGETPGITSSVWIMWVHLAACLSDWAKHTESLFWDLIIRSALCSPSSSHLQHWIPALLWYGMLGVVPSEAVFF